MSLTVLDEVWDPDSGSNADWYHAEASSVVLLDGAAPQNPERVSTLANDAVWLVRRFVEAFQELGAPPGSGQGVLERVEAARQLLEREYAALCASAGGAPLEAPFACLGIAHDTGTQLELFNMGDLTFLISKRDGSVERFGQSAVRELDRQALLLLEQQIARGGLSHAQRLAHVWPQIRANRARRNVLAGYDVLEPGVCCLDRMERASWEREQVSSLLLLSDGFYRLVDTYHVHTDQALFQAVERRGLSSLLQELRALEAADAECVRYPRFKQCDDATALWVR
jgi:hypothetical protein